MTRLKDLLESQDSQSKEYLKLISLVARVKKWQLIFFSAMEEWMKTQH